MRPNERAVQGSETIGDLSVALPIHGMASATVTIQRDHVREISTCSLP